jgi:type I restriction enzyme S subunit
MAGRYKAYPEYKDSGVEWVGNIPSHWKISRIKHIASTPVTDGPHETPDFYDVGIPFISAEAVSSGKINFDKMRGYISPKADKKYSKKYSPQLHDVYIVKSGATTGVVAIVETNLKFNIWSPLAAIRCKSSYDPYFLFYFLRSFNFQQGVELNWTFGTQQNIGMNVIENLFVTKPSTEQSQIANFLDHETAKIDKLIEKQQQLIKLLEEKRQAVISHAVTKGLNPNAPMKDSGIEWLGEVPAHWEIKKLKYSCKLITEKKTTNGMFVVALENIEGKTGKYLPSASKYKGEDTFFRKNDILFGKLRPYLAKVFIAKREGIAFGDLLVFRANSCVKSKFAFYQMISESFIKIVDSTTYGSKMPRASVEFISNMIICLPQLEEQKLIIEFIENRLKTINKLTEKSEKAIQLMQERRTALISAAVTGKIDVRDWSC